MSRRELLAGVAACSGSFAPIRAGARNEMYGLIGKMTAVAGHRDALIEILLESINEMPGCISYVVAKDSADENAIWVTEVWDRKESHDASLSIPPCAPASEKPSRSSQASVQA